MTYEDKMVNPKKTKKSLMIVNKRGANPSGKVGDENGVKFSGTYDNGKREVISKSLHDNSSHGDGNTDSD